MSLLETTIANIRPVNREVQKESMEYIDGLIKPIGSLGKLEKIAAQIAGITGKVKDNDISRRCIIAMYPIRYQITAICLELTIL